MAAVNAGQKRRTIYDAQNQWRLPGKLVRGERAPKSRSAAVNEAYQGAGRTYDFFKKVFAGIPNKAFYEAAMRLGGYAWEKAGLIWYRTLRKSGECPGCFLLSA